MKDFLIYLLKIIILSVGAALVLQSIADKGLKAINNSIYSDWKEVLQGEINSDLIILGSSRGAVSYDPKIIEDETGFTSFNLSYNEGSYNLQDLKFNTYLSKNQDPKIIIQNIDLPHFTASGAIPARHQFLPFLNQQDLLERIRSIDKNFGSLDFIPLIKYNHYRSLFIKGTFSYFGKDYKLFPTENGYIPHDKGFERDVHNIERLKEENNNKIIKYSKGLIFTANFIKNQIPSDSKLFLVWAPEYEERLHLNLSARSFVKQEINELISEFPHVYFIDLSHDPISESKEYFYDTFHLNQKGAELFSHKVSVEIKNILEN